MADSPNTRPVIPLPRVGEKVKFNYEKSNLFRVVHVDGVLGGLTPTLEVFLSIFNQRAPIPKVTVQKISEGGQLGEEVAEERVQKEGIFREVEVGLVMNLNVAKALNQWLVEKIELAKKTQKQIEAEQQREREHKL